MSRTRTILLTGATGLLGRYLLCDLLTSGKEVAVLLRDSAGMKASERLTELLAMWSDIQGTKLPVPMVVAGDLTAPHLGLGIAERDWLARRAGAVVHAAAQVSYRATSEGEPWETNVNGTRRLLELCRSLGLDEVHHLSTAFVCGDRQGPVYEDELDCGEGSGNAYEQSKFAGEQLVRNFPAIQATIYRPSVVVGDSRSGYTSTYHHFYRFLELATRLSAPADLGRGDGGRSDRPRRQHLAVRLPLTGDETQNLVPVDWVSKALVTILRSPKWHGHTFHLVARQPARLRDILAIVEDLLPLEGIQWAGRDALTDATALERMVLDRFQDYWSYLHSNLEFDCRNTRLALPGLPPPRFDRDLAARLLRFARQDHWGRKRLPPRPPSQATPAAGAGCARYLEQTLAQQMQRSPLVRSLPVDILFGLDIRGPGGGRWSCHWQPKGRVEVHRGLDPGIAFTYRTDATVFANLVNGQDTPQRAFFDGQVEIEGDMEKALKLAPLIEQFLAQAAERGPQPVEAVHGH